MCTWWPSYPAAHWRKLDVLARKIGWNVEIEFKSTPEKIRQETLMYQSFSGGSLPINLTVVD